MPKTKPKGSTQEGKEREAAFKAAMTGLALMVAGAGMPGQVRLSSREAQPRPIAPPKKRRGR
jgi:hypothetical protein